MTRMTRDLKRTTWKFLLDLKPGQRVLVLGDSGEAWRLSFENNTQHVSAVPMDVHWQGERLVVGDGSCDFVIVDEVDQALVQAGGCSLSNFVAECRRVLSPSGVLALVLNNRSDLRYRWRCRGDMRNVGFGALHRILRAREFAVVRSWVLAPNVDALRYLWPVAAPQREAGADVPTRSERIFYRLTRTPLRRWFISSALFVANVDKPVALSLGERIAQKVLGAGSFEITRIRAGNPSSVMYTLRTRQGGAMMRLPIDASAQQRCEIHWQALRALDVPDLLQGLVPRALDAGVVDGQAYYCEAVIDGIAIDSPRYPLNRILHEGAQLLIRFQRQTQIPVKIDNTIFERYCGAVFKDLEHAGAPRARLHNVYRYLQTQLVGISLPLVFVHGDYKIENFMIDARTHSIKGIIDWDLSQPQGLPLLDLFYLFTYAEITRNGTSFPRVFSERALPMRWDGDEDRLLQEYLRAIPIPASALTALTILFWLYHIAYRYQVFRWPSAATPRYFDDILATVEACIAHAPTRVVNGAGNA